MGLMALQNGGVDAVMFANEFSMPYLTQLHTVMVAAMARIIGELIPDIRILFGVHVLWDPAASLDLEVSTGARFGREIILLFPPSNVSVNAETLHDRGRIVAENAI
jgi:uncharacterized protein